MMLSRNPSKFLKELGDTSEEVAENLRKLGVKGCKSISYCPIVIALQKYTDVLPGIKAFGDGNLTYDDCQVMDPQSTIAVRNFIIDFDLGKYPGLAITNQQRDKWLF